MLHQVDDPLPLFNGNVETQHESTSITIPRIRQYSTKKGKGERGTPSSLAYASYGYPYSFL